MVGEMLQNPTMLCSFNFNLGIFIFKHEVKPLHVFESVKKLLTQVGFEPTTFGLLALV